MQDVADELMGVRADATKASSDLKAKYANAPEHPIAALMMCFNHATQAVELLSHYDAAWAKAQTTAAGSIEEARAQNGERVVMLGKSLFVFALSSMEFSAKAAAKGHPKLLKLDFSKHIYLSTVMSKSLGAGLIDKAAKDQWDHVIWLRNVIIHNNGVSEQPSSITLSNGLKLDQLAGQMMQGNLLTFPRATRWAIGAYFSWCDAFLAKAP
jgi:hypothetical protein